MPSARQLALGIFVPSLRRVAALIASIYAGLGEKDAAFEWLNEAAELRFGPLIYLKVNPIWDYLRSDPRFQGLLLRVGLVPGGANKL